MDLLLPFYDELTSNDSEIKTSGLKKLKNYVEQSLSLSSQEELKQLMGEISNWILNNIKSPKLSDQYFAVMSIDSLYRCCDQDTILQYANYIKPVIDNHYSESGVDDMLRFSCQVYLHSFIIDLW